MFEVHECENCFNEIKLRIGKDQLELLVSQILDCIFYIGDDLCEEFNDIFDYLSQTTIVVADAIASSDQDLLRLIDEMIKWIKRTFEVFLNATKHLSYNHIQFLGFGMFWRLTLQLEYAPT